MSECVHERVFACSLCGYVLCAIWAGQGQGRGKIGKWQSGEAPPFIRKYAPAVSSYPTNIYAFEKVFRDRFEFSLYHVDVTRSQTCDLKWKWSNRGCQKNSICFMILFASL